MTAPAEERSWPELQEELSRKAIEKITEAVHNHGAGSHTDRELWLIADTVYDVVTGLVPWDIANVVYKVRQEISGDKRRKG